MVSWKEGFGCGNKDKGREERGRGGGGLRETVSAAWGRVARAGGKREA